MLVSVVLLGTAVGGTLTALRTTIISGRSDDDQVAARTLLLAAEDALQRTTYYSCADPGMDEGDIRIEYEGAIDDVPRPDGWGPETVQISLLQFWQKSSEGVEIFDAACPTDPSHIRLSAQLIDIYVLSPGGAVGKTIQVVKGSG